MTNSNFRSRSSSLLFVVAVAGAAGACGHAGANAPAGMTLASAPPPSPQATLLWVGRGDAERMVDGAWQRSPTFDYEFSVEQRRWADHWQSVKTLRRTHPGYDGSAGPRVQVYFFRLDMAPGPDRVDYQVQSTLGVGRGQADHEYREAAFELDADVSMFAPFDRYRITQHYDYEQGRLRELVELSDGDKPWVRNHEEARLFAAGALAAPPTVAQSAGEKRSRR